MKCPTCGFQNPESRLDCEYCGLVFAKWKAKQEAAQKAAEAKTEPPPATAAPVSSLIQDPELRNQSIPDKPEPQTDSFPNPQRIFELLGSLYLQRNSGGVWLYFPWGFIGHGYAVDSPELLDRIRRMETLFSLFQLSVITMLGLLTSSVHYYHLDAPNPWFWILIVYLLSIYSWFYYQSRQLTMDLPLTRRRFNDKHYLLRLFSCFNRVTLLSAESITLLVTLTGIWAFSSNKLFLMVGDSADFLGWLWVGFSLCGFVLSCFIFYFQKSVPP